ncbi:MAG: YHS domain-containing protein [Burkholderiaceae bacterium]|nr:YHS domain-containing protein [Burkholderiaceae bacterium]MDH3460481.1 YHS domain-containing protein [Burkholderiaceae bacterium]
MESLLYFVLWAGLFFVLMRFGCGAHIMGHQHGQHDAHDKHAQGDPKALGWVPPESATDPVCGKTVKTADAKSAVYDATVYYFCSRECRERFEVGPHLYLGPKPDQQPKEMNHGQG